MGWSKAIPEVITFIPVIENKFGPHGTEAEKIINKYSQRVWGYLKSEKLRDIKFSKRYHVFGELFSHVSAGKSREKADTKVQGSLYK